MKYKEKNIVLLDTVAVVLLYTVPTSVQTVQWLLAMLLMCEAVQ